MSAENANFITLLVSIYFAGKLYSYHFYMNELLARVLLIAGTKTLYLSIIWSVVGEWILDFDSYSALRFSNKN